MLKKKKKKKVCYCVVAAFHRGTRPGVETLLFFQFLCGRALIQRKTKRN